MSFEALKYLEKEPLYFEECERETREVSIFKSFLSHVGPFGAVIDGMNVSHAGGKRNIERVSMEYIMYYQESIIKTLKRRSVKRPCINWIFCLHTRASRYTIFRS